MTSGGDPAAAAAAIYGLKYQSKCLEALPNAQDRHCFVLGTCDPRLQPGAGSAANGLNELHFVEFDEQDRRVENLLTVHPTTDGWEGREVLDLCPSPATLGQVFVITQQPDGGGQGGGSSTAAQLWQFNLDRPAEPQQAEENKDNASPQQQQQQPPQEDDFGYKLALSGHQGDLSRLLWDAAGKQHRVVSVAADATLYLWDSFAERPSQPQALHWEQEPQKELLRAPRICWDPHHADVVVSSRAGSLRAWDLRTEKHSLEIPQAHRQPITDVDFNPNRPFYVASAGADRRINVWDIRKAQQPITIVQGHSHWVECVRYNRFHDQLLLSSGSDHAVNLWSLMSASSAPVSEFEAEAHDAPRDHLASSYDEHDDSVYAARWSYSDAWVFASLSFDGRLVVSQVPKAQQYSILLYS